MWKWLCGLAIISVAVISVAYEQHYHREIYEAKRQEDCIALSIFPEEKHACDKDAQNRKDYAPWWNVLMAWPEGVGVWAVILTLGAIAWQSDETKKSADAALLNSQAFINSERPWIKIEVGPKAESRGFGLVIKATNCGKTPAAIVSRNKAFCSIKLIYESLPTNPSYKPDSFEYPKIVHPGDSCELFWILGLKDATGFAEDSPHYQPWIGLDIETYMFGNVVYKDVLGGKDATEYETRWCYTILPLNEPEKFLLVEHQTTEEYSYRT